MLLNLDSPDGSGRSWVDWWLDWVPGRDCWASGHWDPVKMINIFKHCFSIKLMTHFCEFSEFIPFSSLKYKIMKAIHDNEVSRAGYSEKINL